MEEKPQEDQVKHMDGIEEINKKIGGEWLNWGRFQVIGETGGGWSTQFWLFEACGNKNEEEEEGIVIEHQQNG